MPRRTSIVSIIISAFNEKKTILSVVNSSYQSDTLGLKKEIIVIDDGSTDGTKSILQKLRQSGKIKLFSNQKNLGKGASVKLGILSSKGDIVIIQDADLEYSPAEYPKLLKPIIDGYADVVYGSRFIASSPHRVLYFHHYIANKFITTLSNILTNLNLSDIETGYKIFKGDLIRKIAPKLQSKQFGFEPEITARLAKVENLRLYEVGISYYGRTYKEGKKIIWLDGLKAIVETIKYNLF